MTTPMDDRELVAAHLAGDRSALGALYDRYGASLYDTAAAMVGRREDAADVVQDVFVIAAERLDQLRDPDRLKPWLFAIMRNEVYRHTRRRGRSTPIDTTEASAEAVMPSHVDDTTAPEAEELAVLVRGAARGLDERDQLVLELSVRQGLEGADLADALGVTPDQSYHLVSRMRQRVERSLGAFCVARAKRRDCSELDNILAGWDGEFSVLIRKRVARHIDRCGVCERSKRAVAPIALFAGAPALVPPDDLRDRILGGIRPIEPTYGFAPTDGFPVLARTATRPWWWFTAAAAAVVALIAGAFVGIGLLRDGSEASTIAIDPTPSTALATTSTTGAGPPPTTPTSDSASASAAATAAIAPTTSTTSTTSTPSTTSASSSTSPTTSTTSTTPTTSTTNPAPAAATTTVVAPAPPAPAPEAPAATTTAAP